MICVEQIKQTKVIDNHPKKENKEKRNKNQQWKNERIFYRFNDFDRQRRRKKKKKVEKKKKSGKRKKSTVKKTKPFFIVLMTLRGKRSDYYPWLLHSKFLEL